jgi:hypothetical protein
MVVQLASTGILIGADRNITSQVTLQNGSTAIVLTGQSQAPKVLKWPNQEVIVGYVGQAVLAGVSTDQWLYSFIGTHLQFNQLQDLADALTADLNALFHTFPTEPMVLHLAGFEMDAGQWKPRIFFIRNTTSLLPNGVYVVGNQFDCSEEIVQPYYFGAQPGNVIRSLVVFPQYFSFRQGYSLATFNSIDAALRAAMDTLVLGGLQPVPATLSDQADRMKFQIHGYGAYFAAFYKPFEQYVGGGADVVTAAWP